MAPEPPPARSDAAIAELAGMVVVPLRNTHLNEDADTLSGDLSARIAASRPRCLILDLSAITALDSHEFAALVRLARLARLLGCETVAARVTPGVAACLVMIGADPAGIRFSRDMNSILLRHAGPAPHGIARGA